MKDFLKGIVFVGLFLVPFIPLIVVDSMFFPFITGKNFTFRILVEIVFAAWAVLALLDTRYRPRFSWLFSAVSVFLVVMFFANLFGEYPLKSFWSNFERMDGYVTLIHFYLYFVVLSSTLQNDKKLWVYYLWTTVSVAGMIGIMALGQYGEGKFRVDARLGNAAYMAIYMLFQAFFAVYLSIESKQWWSRSIAGLFFLLFVGVLLLTSTRGTFLGLVAGLGITVTYLLIFAKGFPTLRKVALGALVVLVLAAGSLVAFKDAAVVQESKTLKRFANISISDLDIRFAVWGMAYEGFKERPILGWGQGNFNYVFNEQYDPDLYKAESWYDRAHNIMFDWLIAGGILGFIAYMSILLSITYYLFLRPILRKEEDTTEGSFNVLERGLLLGLVAGYFVHNLVVFDNIVSYIFFALTLAIIHGRISRPMSSVQNFNMDPRIASNIVAPVVALCIGTLIYFVNAPGIGASQDIIHALQANTIDGRLTEMRSAIDRESFAYQEVVEQFAQQAIQIGNNQQIAPEQKQAFIAAAEEELLELAKRKPGDARVHVFISGFYRSVGAPAEAQKHIEIARELSPQKQDIIIEQAILAFQIEDYAAMREHFKTAYELQPDYRVARTYYAVSHLYNGDYDEVRPLLVSEADFRDFALNDFALSSANRFEQSELLEDMFAVRIEAKPNNINNRTSLAFVHYQQGETEEAITVLSAAEADFPAYEERLRCYIDNLESGQSPEVGCETPVPAN